MIINAGLMALLVALSPIIISTVGPIHAMIIATTLKKPVDGKFELFYVLTHNQNIHCKSLRMYSLLPDQYIKVDRNGE